MSTINFFAPSQTLAPKNVCYWQWGLSAGLACADPGARTPIGASGNCLVFMPKVDLWSWQLRNGDINCFMYFVNLKGHSKAPWITPKHEGVFCVYEDSYVTVFIMRVTSLIKHNLERRKIAGLVQ